jgi:hypothetical protein
MAENRVAPTRLADLACSLNREPWFETGGIVVTPTCRVNLILPFPINVRRPSKVDRSYGLFTEKF